METEILIFKEGDKAKVEKFIKEYPEIISTKLNKEKTEKGINFIYDLQGYSKPTIYFCDSPYAMLLAANSLSWTLKTGLKNISRYHKEIYVTLKDLAEKTLINETLLERINGKKIFSVGAYTRWGESKYEISLDRSMQDMLREKGEEICEKTLKGFSHSTPPFCGEKWEGDIKFNKSMTKEKFKQLCDIVKKEVTEKCGNRKRGKAEKWFDLLDSDYCEAIRLDYLHGFKYYGELTRWGYGYDTPFTYTGSLIKFFSRFEILDTLGFKKNLVMAELISLFKESGMFGMLTFNNAVFVCQNPKKIHMQNGRISSTTGPAVEWADGFAMNFIAGINFPNTGDLFEKILKNKLGSVKLFKEELSRAQIDAILQADWK